MPSFDVSVVIPLFNKAAYIGEALESVARQSQPANEIIVVDDGSTDDGPALVEDVANIGVALIRQANSGPGGARNRGIAEAKYSWVAFLDADDVWREDHLATLAEVNRAVPGADLIGSGYSRQRTALRDRASAKPRSVDLYSFPPPGPFYTSSAAVRRSTLMQSGGFPRYWPGEDVELWARLALDHEVAISPKITALYRQQTGGLMEQSRERFGGKLELQPIFDTLDSALAEQRYASRHEAIARYRDQWLAIFARQALSAGRPELASAYLEKMRPGSREGGAPLRLLTKLPAPLVRSGIRLRALWRGV